MFPFYWAIVSSLQIRRRRCSASTCWPTRSGLGNYVAVFREQPFAPQHPELAVRRGLDRGRCRWRSAVAAAYALGRIQFRGRTLLLLTILGVSMFPQIAVLSGMFELVRWLGLYNNLLALILSYMIFTLPFTVWVLTTFMRDLPKEIEEAAIVDGAKPWIIVTKVFLPLMGPALATTGLLAFIAAWNEFLFALTFTLSTEQRTVPVAIALISGASAVRAALGQHHGGLGDRHRAADRPGADLPAPDRLRPHRRRGQGLSAHGHEEARAVRPPDRPAPPPPRRLVAGRGDLPDLPAQLPGQRRRRRRRPAGHHARGWSTSQQLGVDAIWISPFFKSPMKDYGYDVADYCAVDPLFGTLADFDALLAEAHRLGLKVMMDFVPSHTSDQHPWFQESRQSRDNPKADWYVWADARPDGTPPNNWLSVFGGSAWEWEPRRGQYYLHNFLKEQPDLNFHNPQVIEALLGAGRASGSSAASTASGVDAIDFGVHDPQLRNNPPRRARERRPAARRARPSPCSASSRTRRGRSWSSCSSSRCTR